MQKKLKDYLSQAGLKLNNWKVDEKFIKELEAVFAKKLPNSARAAGLLSYPVPKLTPDGSCSLSDELEDEPYDLIASLEYNDVSKEPALKLIYRLNEIVKLLHQETGADWTGIYRKLNTKSGPALVKLAYTGKPSRAEFLLTPEFAEHSNNSTVGLTGKAVWINSVKEHLQTGNPYYECDTKVQSELCLPIFSESKQIIGIIDLESFQEKFFDSQKVINAAIGCIMLAKNINLKTPY